MSAKPNIVFLPCRKGSQRVPNKNTRPFAGIEGGLLRIKLEQLLACKRYTSTDDVVRYVPELIKEDATIMWTHVTSPFLKEEAYDELLETYYAHLNEYDSLMSVNELRTFIWNKDGAINYDRAVEKWPRTQTLEPWYEINSGVFIADRAIYELLQDRVGKHVFPYVTSKLESFDIDWPEDFEMAEMMYKNMMAK